MRGASGSRRPHSTGRGGPTVQAEAAPLFRLGGPTVQAAVQAEAVTLRTNGVEGRPVGPYTAQPMFGHGLSS